MSNELYMAMAAALWLSNNSPYTVTVNRFSTFENSKIVMHAGWTVQEGDMVLFAPAGGYDQDGEECPCDQFNNIELLDFAESRGWHRGMA